MVVQEGGSQGTAVPHQLLLSPKSLKHLNHLRKNTSCLIFQMTDLEKQNKASDYCTPSIFYMFLSSVLLSLFGNCFEIRG